MWATHHEIPPPNKASQTPSTDPRAVGVSQFPLPQERSHNYNIATKPPDESSQRRMGGNDLIVGKLGLFNALPFGGNNTSDVGLDGESPGCE